MVAEFCAKRSMTLSPNKCISLIMIRLPHKYKLVDNQRYLGFFVSHEGIIEFSIINLRLAIERIRRAALKAASKLVMISQYLLLTYINALRNPKVTLRAIKSANLVHGVVQHTPYADHHSHRNITCGGYRCGLGIFNFITRIPAILLRLVEEADWDVRVSILFATFSKHVQ